MPKPPASPPTPPPAIDVPLVRRLIAAQFPCWAALPVRPVVPGGWDNRTFRLGDHLSVRLPSAAHYADQVAKEHRWLPHLAAGLPVAIPEPLAMGAPGEGYPWPWSVYRWLEGTTADVAPIPDLPGFARALAGFLADLHRVDPTAGPAPGRHNFFRGGPVATYDDQTRAAIAALRTTIDAGAATAVWEAALDAPWQGPPVCVHGDFAASNVLVRGGALCAVIDFGCLAVGDPACDLAIAWTRFAGESRAAFRAALPLDEATWARGRGWTLWKALITAAGIGGTDPTKADAARRVLAEVLGGA